MEESTKNKISSLYKELKNVWKVGEELGIPGQVVHKVLTERGQINKMNYFTKDDEKYLRVHYKKFRDKGNLKELANKMGRTVPFICRKAKKLGLTDRENRISMKPFSESLSESRKEYYKHNPHPKGMLNKHHSYKFKSDMSKRVKKEWKNPKSKLNSEELRQKRSDYMSRMQSSGKLNNNYSRTKNGTVKIADKTYFYRSSWEVNIAAFLQFKKEKGLIKDWEYEPDVFWFEEIKRGVRSYKPDFKITELDDTFYYIEVKGWMDPKSKTKLKRMAKYYPNIRLDLIDAKRYNKIKQNAGLYKYWGALDSDKYRVEFKKCSIDNCNNKLFKKKFCRKHYYKIYKK